MNHCRPTNETLHSDMILFKWTYQWIVPVLTVVLGLAAAFDLLILISTRFLRRKMTLNLQLSISLAGADCWTSVLMLTAYYLNSYLPVVMGIKFGTKCAMFTLELFR